MGQHMTRALHVSAAVLLAHAGVIWLLIPPLGYLQRLREICDRHGLLLIFDEVITGFGRFGDMFASQALGVVPDMILFAKTVSNGAAPLGGVIVHRRIHDALMQGPEFLAELMHGYTCSGHPLACAAGLAMLETLEQEQKAIQDELADGSLYQRDPQRATQLHARDVEIEDSLMQALERWELLSTRN